MEKKLYQKPEVIILSLDSEEIAYEGDVGEDLSTGFGFEIEEDE